MTSALLGTTTTLTASSVNAPQTDLPTTSATPKENNALASQATPGKRVTDAVQETTSIPSVSPATTLASSVNVATNSWASSASFAEKDFTTIHFAKAATVIQQG